MNCSSASKDTVPVTTVVEVPVTKCVPVVKQCTRMVCHTVPVTKEVTVPVCSYKCETRTGTRSVLGAEVEKTNLTGMKLTYTFTFS